ncbi:hypothetical protein NE237_017827 [Protea cynaroides]|uniref:Uncharacterized protein n=1 Tax=Protea cynaroides TaxID=273540 RepID=A0A9Q0K8R8_9MAGN|nr:hypothetical protein NE237_017827 [Protea cynaroides]
MGLFPEEKALEDNQCMDNTLEEQIISVFCGEDIDDSIRPFNNDFGDDEDSNCSGSHVSTDRTEFWDSKQFLLQEIIEYNIFKGSKLQIKVKEALEEARETALCQCSKPSFDGCSRCLRRAVVGRLCHKGYNASLCTSEWKSTKKFPGGTHEYIDVILEGLGHKKELRYVIELEFRAEFEMVKACDEYQELMNQLPESFVGKPEHLNAIVRVVCSAAKMSMKEMKIHMGPWRKRRFMQMKWSDPNQRCSLNQSSVSSIPLRPICVPVFRYCLKFSGPTELKVS